VLRTALGLSLVKMRPLRIINIRARREKAGLRAQHSAAVTAAARVGAARVIGNEIGSREIEFEPSGVHPGTYELDIGTAGSACLVLQTILPALMLANAPSTIVIQGGTHNPRAPSFDFLAQAFLPLISRMGPRVSARLERYGFYPAGGGRVVFEIEPSERLQPLTLVTRGASRGVRARALVARLPRHVAEREVAVLCRRLALPVHACDIVELDDVRSPGNVVDVMMTNEHVCEVVTGLGSRGVPAERVAEGVARESLEHLDSGAPVGPHLADQLLIPCALAGAGAFRTVTPSLHSTTNAEVIRILTGTRFRFDTQPDGTCRVEVEAG